MSNIGSLPGALLPEGIRARIVRGVNGLDMHVLEAGDASADRPCVLLLHGFPELAYSWRKVMLPLAAAGFHVLAPDQRGYGRTTGWDADYDGDLASFRMLNLATDALALVHAVGRRSVAAVVGHDFGSPVAAWCALLRPDVFRSVVLMSAPFGGAPTLPFNTAGAVSAEASARSVVSVPRPQVEDVHAALAALQRPRKHYQWYYSTRAANADMWHCAQGVHDFLRAYYHHKSADWPRNTPYPLPNWSADALAQLPTYYVMEHALTMAQTVALEMPTAAQIAHCAWLPDAELRVYSDEYRRTGFQGGLQWYRCSTNPRFTAELRFLAGRTIDVPACFIGGRSDWGLYQTPGAFERMQSSACTLMTGCHVLDGAGHWVQQEQPETVSALLCAFVQSVISMGRAGWPGG